VDTELSEPYTRFISEFGIEHTRVLIAANKDGQVRATNDSICAALAFVLNPDNQPLYIHCNQGRHRTGCVVGCLRKLQQWPLDEILAEYRAYASPKTRSTDIELITRFEPESVVQWAADQGARSLQWLQGSIVDVEDVYRLAEAVLPAHNLAQLYRRTSHETFHDSEDEIIEDEYELQSIETSLAHDTGAAIPHSWEELGPGEHGINVIDYGTHQSSNPANVTAIEVVAPPDNTAIDSTTISESSAPDESEHATVSPDVTNANSSPRDYPLRGRTIQPRPIMLDRTISSPISSTIHV
jgi:tyrosine-protein phosphatase SIW14